MILHVALDQKFIDMAYAIFEQVAPHDNEFMVVTKREDFDYIRTTPITRVSPREFTSKRFARGLAKYDMVVLHWMDNRKIRLVMNAPKQVKFVWIGWGGDYYDYIDKNLFLPETNDLLALVRKSSKLLVAKGHLKRVVKLILRRDTTEPKELFDRINFFAPVLEEEFKLIASAHPNFSPQFVDWNYGTIEDDLVRDSNLSVVGNNILVGNSATYESNHLDALRLLSGLKLDGRKILCPLSYGDNRCRDEILVRGNSMFGEKFVPLVDYMTIDEYNKALSTCSVVIMNHLRQQGLGNIVTTMYMGAKVFLNKSNPAYQFFKKSGAVIFSMDELNVENVNSLLDEAAVEINRLVLKNYWGRDVLLDKTKNLISTVVNDRQCLN